MQSCIDEVFRGNQQAVAKKGAGRQGGKDDVVVAVVKLNRPVDAVAEDAVGAGKQGAVGEYFPHRAKGDEDKRKACTRGCLQFTHSGSQTMMHPKRTVLR